MSLRVSSSRSSGRDRVAALLRIEDQRDLLVHLVVRLAEDLAHERLGALVLSDHPLVEVDELGAVAGLHAFEDAPERIPGLGDLVVEERGARGVEASHVGLDGPLLDLRGEAVQADVGLEVLLGELGHGFAAELRRDLGGAREQDEREPGQKEEGRTAHQSPGIGARGPIPLP